MGLLRLYGELVVVEYCRARDRVVCSAGNIVRLITRRRVGGDGEGRGYHQLSAGPRRGAARLRSLLLLALQRRGRLSTRACAQW